MHSNIYSTGTHWLLPVFPFQWFFLFTIQSKLKKLSEQSPKNQIPLHLKLQYSAYAETMFFSTKIFIHTKIESFIPLDGDGKS